MNIKLKCGFIAGPSGVGKDYGVGRVLSEYYGVRTFITGDWCREHEAELANDGHLAADEVIQRAVFADFSKHKDWHYLIDAPRSVSQVCAFLEMFRQANVEAEVHTFHLDGSWESCEARLVDRATRQHRLDDAKPEVIERRLGTYFNKGGIRDTVIPLLRELTVYHPLDGNIDLEQVRKEVRLHLGPHVFGYKKPKVNRVH